MELWDIKGSALKIMFSDSDIGYTKDDFESGALYDNGNTREKLLRMNDSIRRAIDTYYRYCGANRSKAEMKFEIENQEVEGETIEFVTNYLEPVVENDDIDMILRVDLIDKSSKQPIKKFLDYYYDIENDKVEINILDILPYRQSYENFPNLYQQYEFNDEEKKEKRFMAYFSVKEKNLPIDVDDLTYNLNELKIPEDVQRMIPYFIKGEFYEEDEPKIAIRYKSEYIQYLINNKKKFSNIQTRVINSHKRSSV